MVMPLKLAKVDVATFGNHDFVILYIYIHPIIIILLYYTIIFILLTDKLYYCILIMNRIMV